MNKHRKKPWWQKFNTAWIPEIIVVGSSTVIVVFLLLFKLFNINFWIEIERLGLFFQNFLEWLLTPTTFIAIIFIIAVLYFAFVRIRYHLLRLAKSNEACPVCNHKIHKRHRKTYERLFSYYIPVRRYYCRYCGWKGLRVYKKKRIGDSSRYFK